MVLKTHLEPFRAPLIKVPPVGQPKNIFFLRMHYDLIAIINIDNLLASYTISMNSIGLVISDLLHGVVIINTLFIYQPS